MTCPDSTDLRLTTPAVGAVIFVRSQIQLGLRERRCHLLHARVGDVGTGFRHAQLFGTGTRCLQRGLCL